MASFSAKPRPLPTSFDDSSDAGNWDPDSEQPEADKKYDDKKDEPGITETLKFDKFAQKFEPPTHGTSTKPAIQRQASRPFAPSYQKSMPTDIVPFEDAVNEEETWEKFLERAKERGVPLGRKARAVQNYIKVSWATAYRLEMDEARISGGCERSQRRGPLRPSRAASPCRLCDWAFGAALYQVPRGVSKRSSHLACFEPSTARLRVRGIAISFMAV